MSSIWDTLGMGQLILEILNVQPEDPGHHFGRPFLTPYQIAIEFARRFPDAFQQINKPIGGRGTGRQDSLAQYIGNQLGQRIGRGEMPTVQGAFLHRQNLRTLQYNDRSQIIESSSMQSSDLSVYRRTD